MFSTYVPVFGSVQDADIMWFRDPFPRFDKHADFQIACDSYTGIPGDLQNSPNGGFLYARSNNRTIDFYKYWYMSREDHPGMHDQDVLNAIKTDEDFLDIGLELRFLNTLYFGGFCQVSPKWYVSLRSQVQSTVFGVCLFEEFLWGKRFCTSKPLIDGLWHGFRNLKQLDGCISSL